MTAASPGPHLFSTLNSESDVLFRSRKDTFVLSLLGQTAVLAIIVYFTSCVARTPEFRKGVSDLARLPLSFPGFNAAVEEITIIFLPQRAAHREDLSRLRSSCRL
jgi:hypothetical protein